MSGVVGFLGRAGMRLAAATLLRAGIRRLWPRLKAAIAQAGIGALLRKFWVSVAATLTMLVVIGFTTTQALFGHETDVRTASTAIESQRLTDEAQPLDSSLDAAKADAHALILAKHPKAAVARRTAAAKLLQLAPLAQSGNLTPAAIERRRLLLAGLAAKAAVPITLPKKPGISLDPALIARAQQLKQVPQRSAVPVGVIGLAWAVFALLRKLIRHGAMLVLPAKVLAVGAAVLAALAGGMQYCGITFASAALIACGLGTVLFFVMTWREAQR